MPIEFNLRRSLFWLSLCLCVSVVSPLSAQEWTHWRGPLQTGYSPEKNLPDEWDPRTIGKNNLIWKQPYGCRSTPLVMNGKVYITGADKEPLGVPTTAEKKMIGERVTCFDAAKGTKIWEYTCNVFHTDIVASRLGWAPLAGDSANKHLFVHTTGGFLICFDSETGKILWQRQLTEEFGRTTGYGGRVGGGPIFDSGLVIVGLINSSWGNFGIGTNRLFAFDGKTGELVWNSQVPGEFHRNTYYSNPVVAVINGQRMLLTGGADGALTAYHVRTGKPIWTYMCCSGVINPAPVVDGNFVYIAHGEENPEGAAAGLGRVVCVDGSKVTTPKGSTIGRPTVVWEFKKGIRFGLASLGIAEGKLYVPDDAAKLYCFDAKKGGNPLWKYDYGKTSRGSPLIADNKIYIAETVGKFHIIKLKEDGTEPDEAETHTITFRPKTGSEGTFVESNCTPSVVNGRIYLASRDELYCIGKANWKSSAANLPTPPKESPGDVTKGYLAILPGDVTLSPGGKATFKAQWFSDTGVPVNALPPFDGAPSPIEWSLPTPPLPKGAMMPPPPLKGDLEKTTGATCYVTVDPKMPAQVGYVEAKIGSVTARARVRVVPGIPYAQDFEKTPVGATPGGWINTQGKYRVVELKEADGTMSKVLMKVNTNASPPVAGALGFITAPTATGYTIEADLKGLSARGTLPDLGVCANRYILILDGKTDNSKRQVRITTWEALPTPLPPGRIAVEKDYTWKENVWYRVKLTVEVGEKEAIVRGKVWERGQNEPKEWTMELTDPRPNREGAAALYGKISNASETEAASEAYFDNVKIVPNAKK